MLLKLIMAEGAVKNTIAMGAEEGRTTVDTSMRDIVLRTARIPLYSYRVC